MGTGTSLGAAGAMPSREGWGGRWGGAVGGTGTYGGLMGIGTSTLKHSHRHGLDALRIGLISSGTTPSSPAARTREKAALPARPPTRTMMGVCDCVGSA